MQVKDLVDRAQKAIGGTPTDLARRLGVKPPVVFGWVSGDRTCTAEDRALLADIAGVDPFPEIAAAMLERWAGKPKEAMLRHALGYGNRTSFPQFRRSLTHVFFMLARPFNHLLTVDGLAPTARATCD